MEGPFPLASAATKAAMIRAAQRVTVNAEVMIDSCCHSIYLSSSFETAVAAAAGERGRKRGATLEEGCKLCEPEN
jgi:hypothetical protein